MHQPTKYWKQSVNLDGFNPNIPKEQGILKVVKHMIRKGKYRNLNQSSEATIKELEDHENHPKQPLDHGLSSTHKTENAQKTNTMENKRLLEELCDLQPSKLLDQLLPDDEASNLALSKLEEIYFAK